MKSHMKSQPSFQENVVNVIFDTDLRVILFTGDINDKSQIRISSDAASIQFPLRTVGRLPHGEATYDQHPVLWRTESPTLSASTSDVSLIQLGVVNGNLSTSENHFPFQVKVWYQEKLYTSHDPTIITEPREGGIQPVVPPACDAASDTMPAEARASA